MMNVKKHYIYNDKFTLNVLDLNEIFEEICDTVFTLNQDDKVRYWCEEGKRIERTYQAIIAKKNAEIAEKDALIAKLLAEREESRK